MRHILFALLVAQYLQLDAELFVNLAFVLNAVSMHVPYPLPYSIRSLTTSTPAIAGVNLALGVAWLLPVTALPIAACFVGTYLYSLGAGALSWIRQR